MSNKLSRMSLEEQWELFPIILKKPNKCYKEWFSDEKARILSFLPDNVNISMHHIGSTAIGVIWAKPTVDILAEIPKDTDMKNVGAILSQNGYTLMSSDPERLSFNMGYTETGFAKKVFHLHLRYIGDNNELYFRDYLIDNPEIAKEYEKLKLSLWKKYEHNRDAYTNAKGNFVTKYTNEAKIKYIGRY